MQKLVVGFLMLTLVGAVGYGIYDASGNSSAAETSQFLAGAAPETAVDVPVEQPAQSDPVAVVEQQAATQPELVVTPTVEPAAAPLDTTVQPQQQQLQQATTMVGDPWSAQGTILSFSTAGMTLALSDGSEAYVELGPSHYWQAQSVTLAVGEVVTVEGFYNGDQYHAATVTKADGSQLVVRTAEGLPLWSGGASNNAQQGTTTDSTGQGNQGSQGQNGQGGQGQSGQSQTGQGGNGQGGNGNGGNGQGSAGTTNQIQVAAEDWITLDGTVTAIDVNGLTMQTQAGETLTFQLGQAQFANTQGVTFAAGDEISVKGYWQDDVFHAGEVTKLATGERLLLLDPNGRPLWGGPGRAGQGQGGGGGQSQGGSGQGGNGNRYRGGR